jgi:hypothetical protein
MLQEFPRQKEFGKPWTLLAGVPGTRTTTVTANLFEVAVK